MSNSGTEIKRFNQAVAKQSFLSDIQRFLLYCYFFSFNFEMYDPTGSGFLSMSKIFAIPYILSVLPELGLFLTVGKYYQYVLLLIGMYATITFSTIIFQVPESGYYFFNSSHWLNVLMFIFILNHNRKEPGVLYNAMLAFAIGSVVETILFFGEIGVTERDDRLTIFGDNENVVGVRISIGLLLLLLGSIENLNRKRFWSFLIMILPVPFMMFFVLKTGSRSAIGTLTLSLLLFAIFNNARNRFFKLVFILSLIIGSISAVNYLMTSTAFVKRVVKTTTSGDMAERQDIWPLAIDIGLSNPLIGAGESKYFYTINKLYGKPSSPHNVIIEIFAYSGFIGLSLFLIFIGRLLFGSVILMFRDNKILAMILLIPILGQIISGQILVTKIAWMIFAFIIVLYEDYKKRKLEPV